MKKAKIIKSVWIPVISLFIGTIIMGVSTESYQYYEGQSDLAQVFMIGILGSIFSFFTYGLIFWLTTLLLIICIELFAVRNGFQIEKIKSLFIIELFFISLPFIYFAITQDYPIWYYFILVFTIGQILRYRALRVALKRS